MRESTESRIHWTLGKGLVDFWDDSWCIDTSLASLVTGHNKSYLLVREFFRSTSWDEHRLRQLLPGHIVDYILQLQVFPKLPDRMVWTESSSRNFIVSSAWELVRPKQNFSVVYSLIWSPVIPLKISFFLCGDYCGIDCRWMIPFRRRGGL